jgi:hypothetical protein
VLWADNLTTFMCRMQCLNLLEPPNSLLGLYGDCLTHIVTNLFTAIYASITFKFESSISLRRLGNYLPDYTIARFKMSRFKHSLLWKTQTSLRADGAWSAVMACGIALCVILPTRDDSKPCEPFHCIQITYAQCQYAPFCDSSDTKSWYGNKTEIKFPLCTL